MNWYEKFLAQFSRIFGGDAFTEEMSEAEAVTALEKVAPIAELQGQHTKAIETIQAEVEKANQTISELQETIKTQTEQIKGLTESQASKGDDVSQLIKDLRSEIQSLREETGKEFNTLKGVRDQAEQKPPIAAPVQEKRKDEKVISGNFLDTHLKAKTIGLN